jgi:hypothetical protein
MPLLPIIEVVLGSAAAIGAAVAYGRSATPRAPREGSWEQRYPRVAAAELARKQARAALPPEVRERDCEEPGCTRPATQVVGYPAGNHPTCAPKVACDIHARTQHGRSW